MQKISCLRFDKGNGFSVKLPPPSLGRGLGNFCCGLVTEGRGRRAQASELANFFQRAAGIGEPDRETLRGHGFTESDIWDIAETAAFFNMSNRMASAVGMQPNAEYHSLARG